jgi:hypothetical protein
MVVYRYAHAFFLLLEDFDAELFSGMMDVTVRRTIIPYAMSPSFFWASGCLVS